MTKGSKIFILDSCRSVASTSPQKISQANTFEFVSKDNALSFSGSDTDGLTQIENIEPNVYLVYAASPGKPAYTKSSDRNSIFTKNLIEVIKENQASDLQSMIMKVRDKMVRDSEYDQVPWDESSLTRKFFFDQVN